LAETRKTLCNRDCPDACGIVATVEDGRVVRLAGDPDHPVTRGFLCYRTNRFLSTQYAPDRLTRPLLKKAGAFEAVSFDEAMDYAAEKLLRIREESGPEAIFHYSSGGTLGLMAKTVDYFFNLFGPVTKKRGDICSGAGEAAQTLDFGVSDSHDLFDLRNARHIILWGKNPVVSSPHTVPVLREARERGARILLVDPVHHESAKLADEYFQVRPGGDIALAMATSRVLLEEGMWDPDAPSYCDHLDAYRALVEQATAEEWAALAGVEPRVPRALAAALGPGKPCAILVGWGMGRRIYGGASVRAVDALGTVSGNIGIPGGGVSYYFARRAAFNMVFDSPWAPPPRTICEPLLGSELMATNDPPIRAIWINGGNPVAMLPDSRAVQRALSNTEFVVVVDNWLSDTAQCADLVLPTTTLLESDDLLGAYGHHFLGVSQPVVPPPDDAKSDFQIIQELARRVGLGEPFEGDEPSWKRRMMEGQLENAGVSLEVLEEGPLRSPVAPEVLFSDRVFSTPTGRMNLLTQLPPMEEARDPAYPLKLMALSTRHSQCSQWAGEPPSSPLVLTIHPDAAEGCEEGAVCRLESPSASMPVRLRFDEEQRADVALLPKGGHLRAGTCANALIPGRITDLGEGGALYDEGVRLIPG